VPSAGLIAIAVTAQVVAVNVCRYSTTMLASRVLIGVLATGCR
jgi:hypothetical protein